MHFFSPALRRYLALYPRTVWLLSSPSPMASLAEKDGDAKDRHPSLPIEVVLHHSIQRREDRECPICLEDFKEGDPVKRLPCGHIFHAACVKEWVVEVRGVCPLCRQGIFTKDACVSQVRLLLRREKAAAWS